MLADPLALREIAVNLIDNAIRYTPGGGAVTVRVASDSGQITLAVEDNGPGVAPEHREKIFQRFFRLDASDGSGSGLGLAIVKELATQCGAVVRVETPQHGGQGLLLRVAFASA